MPREISAVSKRTVFTVSLQLFFLLPFVIADGVISGGQMTFDSSASDVDDISSSSRITFSQRVPESPPTNVPVPFVEINKNQLHDGKRVPAGELTINGFSSDNEDANCEVFADVNDIPPMQKVSAAVSSAGHSGQIDDFSRWVFTYTEDYQLIKEGSNELTAKISCLFPGNPNPLSEWHTVNVTGISDRELTGTDNDEVNQEMEEDGVEQNEVGEEEMTGDEDDNDSTE
jgi:hypothetical protein